jgi:SAM-dependent methyltransferase
MIPGQKGGETSVELHAFTDLDHVQDLAPYFAALEVFDERPQLQELKALARTRAAIGAGSNVLDVGCGFGLESLKLARLVEPGGHVTGIDKSAVFIKEAQARARKTKVTIDFQAADAEALPFQAGAFDVTRAERVLVYLPNPQKALNEMGRVTRPGGAITAIEPDFGTNAINFPDRELARRVLDHECDANVPQGLLVRDMAGLMHDVGLSNVRIDTRIVIFPPGLAAPYFTQMGTTARTSGVISPEEHETWTAGIEDLRQRDRLFCSIGYYLFAAQA